MNRKSLNLYIHIPFCAKKCHYCAFYSSANADKLILKYTDALLKEIDHVSNKLLATDYKLQTIYFGGGTPSLVASQQIIQILESIPKTSVTEITLEANPESLTKQKLVEYRKSGINRLSIGLQAWQDHHLVSMGRAHSKQQFIKGFNLAREAGFKNINIDLIFGFPTQTFNEWHDTLDAVIMLKPEHISCYSLELDNLSQWGVLHTFGKLTPPHEALDRDMYRLAISLLQTAGYQHYELSNFANPGYECQHNLDFWNNHEYVGLGAGAHSFINGIHSFHSENILDYCNNPCTSIQEQPLSPQELDIEMMIKGLRLTQGISIPQLTNKYQIDKAISFGLLEVSNTIIKPTLKGFDLYNQLISTLIN